MKKTSVALLAAIALFCVLLSSECYAVTYAYISNSKSDVHNVYVINTTDNTFTATVTVGDLGDTPWGVAVDPNGEYVYVTDNSHDNVFVIRTSDNKVTATVTVGDPGDTTWGVAVDPNGEYVYVANSDGTVSVIRTSDNNVTPVTVGGAPWGVAVTPNGEYVYVTNNSGNNVSVIRTSDNDVTPVTVGDAPMGVAVDPNGDNVYVANNSDDNVSVIDTSDNSVVAWVTVGDAPWGVAVTPNGKYVYVTNNSDDNVSVIDTYDNSVFATVQVGKGPQGVAVDLDGDYVYVVNNSDATVSVISISNNKVVKTIKNVGTSPVGLGKFIGGEPLQAPSDLVATTVSDEAIDLSWTDNAYDESGFKIERKQHEETFTEIDTADANATSYRDKELDSETTYYYRIRAYNDDGNSDYSNEAEATTDEDESDDCVISAGAQGTPLEPHVNVLRDFRDDFLLSNTVGKSFTDFYYTYSPPLAGIVAKHDSLRGMVCLSLLPVIGVSWVALKLGRVLTMAPILLLLALIGTPAIVLFRRTRLRGHRT